MSYDIITKGHGGELTVTATFFSGEDVTVVVVQPKPAPPYT